MDTMEEFKSIKKPLDTETEEEKIEAKRLLRAYMKPYRELPRANYDGEINIGTSLKFREDFYAYTFLHWMKRRVIFDDGDISEEKEEEPEVEEEKDTKLS